MPESNLLAYISLQCHDDCIFNLTRISDYIKVMRETVCDERFTFSLDEWIEAIHYICSDPISFSSLEEVSDYLKNYM